MILLYNLSIRFYRLIIIIAATTGNKKAQLWLFGRKHLFKQLKAQLQPNERRVWFHFASLGEFEQGRPVLEAFKKEKPEFKIFVTFFSPSGYEIRKNYEQTDYLFYLPLDTPAHAQTFIDLVNPELVFFTKYEYWYHYFKELNKRTIPLYIVSAIFRKEQLFFKWYGSFYRELLGFVTYFFVQNEASSQLLNSIGFSNHFISGDTRFDRVASIKESSKPVPVLEPFLDGRPVLVAGSTWPADGAILAEIINRLDIQVFIAPHEIKPNEMAAFQKLLTKKSSLLSENTTTNNDVVIIDQIGLLAQIYQYANIAYIGGGFGKGIHNTLEAAVWGIPVIFGPNYQKFAEAKGLIHHEAAACINNGQELLATVENLLNNPIKCNSYGTHATAYLEKHKGATTKIIHFVLKINNH